MPLFCSDSGDRQKMWGKNRGMMCSKWFGQPVIEPAIRSSPFWAILKNKCVLNVDYAAASLWNTFNSLLKTTEAYMSFRMLDKPTTSQTACSFLLWQIHWETCLYALFFLMILSTVLSYFSLLLHFYLAWKAICMSVIISAP